jgi:hypothetical protein
MIALEPTVQIPASAKSVWPHLNADTVLNRLDELRQDPNLIDQGALGLCGEATFFHHVLRRDPVGFVAMAQVLLMSGIGVLGKLVIRPDFDLRLANYPMIDAARVAAIALDPTLAPMPPQADWMVLSALRDTENEILDFEGTPGESVAEGSNFQELFEWHQKSELYTSVTKDENTDLAHVKTSVLKTPSNHIALRIRVAMIQSGTGNHIISLASPFMIDEVNKKVTFTYWTWGRSASDPKNTANLTLNAFTNTYLGAIIATF